MEFRGYPGEDRLAWGHGEDVPFDDFSAPRNTVAATGDWILLLDADERLVDGSIEGLRAVMARDDVDAGVIPCFNAPSLDTPVDDGARRKHFLRPSRPHWPPSGSDATCVPPGAPMSRFQIPSDAAIRGHVGAEAQQQGRALAGDAQVEVRYVGGSTLLGSTHSPAASPVTVTVLLRGDEILSSTCATHAEGACAHVAAVLFELAAHPKAHGPAAARHDARAKLVASPTQVQVQAWAKARLIEDIVNAPANKAMNLSRYMWSVDTAGLTVGDLLSFAHSRRRTSWQNRAVTQLMSELRASLVSISDTRFDAIEYVALAEAWRSVPPREPELLPLWTRLRTQPGAPPPWRSGLLGLPDLSGVRVKPDPPTLLCAERWGGALPEFRLSLLPQGSDPGANHTAVDVALDLLTHPALAADTLRAEVLTQVRIPAWQRVLGDLDALLRSPQEQDADGRMIGWRVGLDGGVPMVQCVRCRPYKQKAGMRVWEGDVLRSELPLAADRVAAQCLSESFTSVRGNGAVNRALLALVGHPRVMDSAGAPLAVRRGRVSMLWEGTEDGGVRMVMRVGERALNVDELQPLLASRAGELALFLEPAAGRVSVVDLAEDQARVVDMIRRRGDTFPAEAREALMERIVPLTQRTPLELDGDLRGEEVVGDPRPLLRLTLGVDGALELRALSRPLAVGTPWPPGVGPREVTAVVDGKRVFAVREIEAERAAFEQALSGMGLPDSDDFCWLLEGDEGLEVVLALRAAGDRFRLEWTRVAPTISRRARPDDLRVVGAARRDWFGLKGGLDVDGVLVPLAVLLDAVRANRRFVAVGDGTWVALTDELREGLRGTASVARAMKDAVELPPLASAALLPLQDDGADITLPKALRVQLERLHEAQTLEAPLPEGLRAELRPYQLDGFRWLARLAHWAPGAVLADDMGLGKTLQALALLLRRAQLGAALVVAPASVGINWEREAARFAPNLKVHSYRGGDRQGVLARMGPGDLLVTSWELMCRDAAALTAAHFATVVLDEAQAIKNADTQRARTSAELGGDFTLALTGTPVENRVGEVWSLMRTAAPGLLGPAQRFRERFVGPIERDGDDQARRALAQLLRPFILRRIKSQVALDLPERSEVVIPIELSSTERRLYDTFRDATVAELQGASSGSPQAQRFRILQALTRLRQLACHPALVDPDGAPSTSTKIVHLVRILRDLRDEGQRALVFSQFVTLLKLAREALEADGLAVRYLDGSTPIPQRQAEVDAFQRGEGDAFLISLKAGGTGLNLTAASYVIHLDPWWNPAVEDQATDRAHRIGQTQPVTVYRLVATNTIEEEVLAMHGEKRALVAGLLEGTGKAAALSSAELMAVLTGEDTVLEIEPLAEPIAEVPVAETPPSPSATSDDTALAGFEAHLRAQDFSVRTTRNFCRAVQNILRWAREQGHPQPAQLAVVELSERYLSALEAGAIATGRSDLSYGRRAYRLFESFVTA